MVRSFAAMGVVLMLFVTFAAGCSGAPGTEDAEPVAATREALELAATCEAALNPPSVGACQGPWDYEEHQDSCMVQTQDNRCPVRTRRP